MQTCADELRSELSIGWMIMFLLVLPEEWRKDCKDDYSGHYSFGAQMYPKASKPETPKIPLSHSPLKHQLVFFMPALPTP